METTASNNVRNGIYNEFDAFECPKCKKGNIGEFRLTNWPFYCSYCGEKVIFTEITEWDIHGTHKRIREQKLEALVKRGQEQLVGFFNDAMDVIKELNPNF